MEIIGVCHTSKGIKLIGEDAVLGVSPGAFKAEAFTVGGYYVRQPKGYNAFVSKDVFEAEYLEL